MKIIKSLKKMLAEAKLGDTYWIEKAKLDFSIALEGRRRANGMNYKDVADKIGTSQPYVTKVFRGDANLTIETMVKLARATGGRLDLHIADAHAPATVWDASKFKDSRTHKAHPTGASETVVRGVNFGAANGRHWATDKMAA